MAFFLEAFYHVRLLLGWTFGNHFVDAKPLRACEKMGTGTGLVSKFARFFEGWPEPVPIFSHALSYRLGADVIVP